MTGGTNLLSDDNAEELQMEFRINQNGLKLIISTDNKLCLQIEKKFLSQETLLKYKHLLIGDVLRVTKPVDELWKEPVCDCNYKSDLENVKSHCISKERMICALKSINSSCVLYTGAGISRAADIMTCSELYNKLFINSDYDNLVENYIENSDYILAQFKMFCMRLLYSKPTKAHIKIAELVKKTKCIIATENLDNLHQKTGIIPINPFIEKDKLLQIRPNKVFLLGVGCPMCSEVFDHWYDAGAEFYAINKQYLELNVPTKIYVGNIQGFLEESDV